MGLKDCATFSFIVVHYKRCFLESVGALALGDAAAFCNEYGSIFSYSLSPEVASFQETLFCVHKSTFKEGPTLLLLLRASFVLGLALLNHLMLLCIR